MIFKKEEHIYYLKDKYTDISWLKERFSEMGYELIELDHQNDIIEIIKASQDKRSSEQQSHLFLNNLSRESEKKCINRLIGHTQWLIQIMNELKIGFVLSDGHYPFMMNIRARDILQKDPGQIERHPLCEAVIEDHQETLAEDINQLTKREVSQYKENIQIDTPQQEGKNILIYGRYLEVDGLSIIAEYFTENVDGESKKEQKHNNIPSLIPELHRILIGLCSITTLLDEKSKDTTGKHSKMERQRERYNLTRRETQILQFIYEGYTSQKIAEKLYISKRTVESHRANILHKTNAKNTADLIRFAIHHKFL